MSDGRYIKIVPKERIDYAGGLATIKSDKADVYKPLKSIAYPANNGHADWTETVVLRYTDGSTERVRGHVVESGHVTELEGEADE